MNQDFLDLLRAFIDHGVVKILDFGLAKALDVTSSSDANPENSPTLTAGATVVGAILGTAAYMSPEQARGKTADSAPTSGRSA